MLAKPVWGQIVDDDALTRGLGDPEARMLVEWLVERAEWWANRGHPEGEVGRRVGRLCRRARGMARFVRLWCYEDQRGAAIQLAAVERYPWPLPARVVDPCELMHDILCCEAEALEHADDG